MSDECCGIKYPKLYEKENKEESSFLCYNHKLTPLGEQYWFFLKKAIAWRLLATLITFFVAAVVTGDFTKASQIGGIEMAIKIIVYMAHERIWESTRNKICVDTNQQTTANSLADDKSINNELFW